MSPAQDDPAAKHEVGVDIAADRRRPGRPASVSPELIPLLRGQIDPNAPADPVIARPGKSPIDRELLAGAVIVAALALAGLLVRFAV